MRFHVYRKKHSLILRFKLPELNYIIHEKTQNVRKFIERYVNGFKFTFSDIFSTFFSINEHLNREKLSRAIETEIQNLEKLFIVLYSFNLYESVKNFEKLREVYDAFNFNIMESINFLNLFFENTKLGFIPDIDFKAALKVYYSKNFFTKFDSIDRLHTHSLCTNDSNQNTSQTDLLPYVSDSTLCEYKTEMERLIKITLIGINYDINMFSVNIEGPNLTLETKNITVALKLTGTIESSSWNIISIKGLDFKYLQIFQKTFMNKLQLLFQFIAFFEKRKLSEDICNHLSNVKGNADKFVGYIKDFEISGVLHNDGNLVVSYKSNLKTGKLSNFYSVEELLSIIK